MDTQSITLDPSKARELWRAYRKHQHYSEPIDREIMAAYQKLAQGKLIIKALDSIVKAGLGADRLPKLALVRADKKACRCTMDANGSAVMSAEGYDVPWRGDAPPNSCYFRWPAGTFSGAATRYGGRAITPLIPIDHRPKRGLANYHILFEAEWSRVPPRDPYLLRRIGKSDMWVVLAMWDLTEIERAALAARIA
jgi:hypothetical protein